MVNRMKRYLLNLLISVDQLINTIFGGYPDETISSRIGKRVVKGDSWFCNILSKLLNLVDKNHCIDAIEKDEGEPM
jgi:hypothetical protein